MKEILNLSFKEIAICIAIVFLLVPLGIGITKGSSMHPNVKDSHVFLYSKASPLTRTPRGSVVVIEDDDTKQLLIKRVIGVGGDNVYMLDGIIVGVNDVMLRDMYLSKEDYNNVEVIQVPPNEIFYIGDNQDNSVDSRHVGTVPISWIKGRVFLVF